MLVGCALCIVIVGLPLFAFVDWLYTAYPGHNELLGTALTLLVVGPISGPPLILAARRGPGWARRGLKALLRALDDSGRADGDL